MSSLVRGKHFVQGVLEFHDQEHVEQHMDVSIEYFLDRFYMSLISLRMLVNQHVLLFAPGADQKTKRIGVIDPECKLKVPSLQFTKPSLSFLTWVQALTLYFYPFWHHIDPEIHVKSLFQPKNKLKPPSSVWEDDYVSC